MTHSQRQERYWRRNLRLTLGLLAVWFLVSFVLVFFAEELHQIRFFGWPLSYYMGAQGALVVYVVIIWVYAYAMKRLDEQFGVHDEEETL